MLRIEKEIAGPRLILRLIGRLHSEQLGELREKVRGETSRFLVLDLADVHLVDLHSIRFLCDCQDQKIELHNCAPYILEWMRRERAEESR
jgi:hypothetical protein